MKVIVITTRNYYKLIETDGWDKVEIPNISNFVKAKFSSCNEWEAVKDMFCQEDTDAAYDFWEQASSASDFKMLRRDWNEYDTVVYIVPCIPEYHFAKKSRLLFEIKDRQDFVDALISDVQIDLSEANPDDFLLIVHEKDIMRVETAEERTINNTDLCVESKLTEVVNNGLIDINSIYGFKHIAENVNNVFYVINNICEFLGKDVYNEFLRRINERNKDFEL